MRETEGTRSLGEWLDIYGLRHRHSPGLPAALLDPYVVSAVMASAVLDERRQERARLATGAMPS